MTRLSLQNPAQALRLPSRKLVNTSLLESDALAQQFAAALGDVGSLSAMMGASKIGRVASIAFRNTLGRNLAFFAPVLGEVFGTATEAAAYTLFTHSSGHSFTHHFTHFSVLKMAAFLSCGSGFILQHSLETTGMVLADELTGAPLDKTLSQRFVEASVFGIQNRVSMGAAHLLTPLSFHRFAVTGIPHIQSFAERIETTLKRRPSSGFLARSIGLSLFLQESLAAANPLKTITRQVHERIGTPPLIAVGLGIVLYLGYTIVGRTLWAPHPDPAFARKLIKKHKADIVAFFSEKWWPLNRFFKISNGSTVAFRGDLSFLGIQRSTLLGLLTIEGHTFPVAVKRSAKDILVYSVTLQSRPEAWKFFPQLYGIVGDYIIAKRLKGLEGKELNELTATDSESRRDYISNVWTLVRNVYQQGLLLADDVDVENGSNIIFNPKTREVHLVELGSFYLSSGAPPNILASFLTNDRYGLSLSQRHLSSFDFAFIEEALRQQGTDETPFTLDCWAVRNQEGTVQMNPLNLELFRAFRSKKIQSYGRVMIAVRSNSPTPMLLPLESLEPNGEDTFHLREG